MMEKSKMSLQKEIQTVVDPLSLRKPSFRQRWTTLHPPPPSLQPSKHKSLRSTQPSSTNSLHQSLEFPKKVSNLTPNNQHLQSRSMSLSSNQGRTHALPDEFDLRKSAVELDTKHQESCSKTRAIIKDGPNPKGGNNRMDDGFKCSVLCISLSGFGKSNKAKPVKAIKGETKMDHYVSPVMSSTFSFKIFEDNSGVKQGMTHENNEDESISSYFELPSQVFKCSGDGA